MPEKDAPIKVLYIAGMNRSGSTLLGRLLNEVPGAVHVGEIAFLLAPGFLDHGRCGCLRTVQECEFWQAVLERAFGGLKNLDLERLRRTRQTYRIRRLPRLLTARPSADLTAYLEFLSALYRAVAEVASAQVVVDGSKDVLYGALLRRAPALSVRAVHLVRDSRAVAYSYSRVKHEPPLFENPGRLEPVTPLRTALRWNAANLLLDIAAAGPVGPSELTRLRYEDFIAAPATTLARLWDWIGEPAPDLRFLSQTPIPVSTGHTVAGNPDRFETSVRLRLDDAWRTKLPPRRRALVTALTFPLLLRYGYLSAVPARHLACILAPVYAILGTDIFS